MKEQYIDTREQPKDQPCSYDDIVLIASHIRKLENKTKHLENQQVTQGYKLNNLNKIIKSGKYLS